ncbi:MAG: hypothetical protein V4594_06845 [Bacteroidota bacterium]
MKTLNLKSALFIAMIALGVACKKENESVKDNTVNTAKEFMTKFGSQKQVKEINASTLPQTLTFLDGTKIVFPVGSLTKGGVPVTGNVSVEVYEVLKRSAVLLSGTNTNHSSGAPLESDGFIFIDVKSDGSSVDQNLAVPIKISIPTKKTSGVTQLWVGVDQDNKPLAEAAGAQMAWAAPRAANGVGGKEVGVTAANFTFDFGNLGWINCDVFYSYANPKTTVTVDIANNPGSLASFRGFGGETFVFFCAKGSNVAAQLYTPNGINGVKSYDNMMPIGVEGRMLSFSIKNGRYYYASVETTITANQNISLTLAETTESAVQAAINSLDSY